MLFFSLERGFLFKLILFVWFFTQDAFFASEARTFSMEETDSLFFRRSVCLFIPPANTVRQTTTYMYY